MSNVKDYSKEIFKCNKKQSLQTPFKVFIVVLADIVATVDCTVAVDYIADSGLVEAWCTVALGRTVAVAAADYIVDFGRIVAIEYNLIANKIARRLVEPPVDSFGAWLAVKYFAHVQAPLAPVARLERYSSRALSAGRKLDWRSGRRLLATAQNFAAYAP